MGNPFNSGSGHINQALGNLVVKHPTLSRFIADEICNVVPVQKESDAFFRVDSAGMLDQSLRTPRANGGESNEVGISWQSDSYVSKEHALHADLDWNTRDNADSQLGVETEAAAVPREAVLLAKEIRCAAAIFNTNNLTNTTGTAARWDDSTAANIKAWQDILGARRAVKKFGGAQATHIAMGDITWTSLAKYLISQAGSPAGVRWMGLANLLKEDPQAIPETLVGLRLLVGDATYSTAKKAADVSRASSGGNISDVWADNALVFHKGSPGVKSVQLAARFVLKGYPQVRTGDYAGPRKASWYEYCEHESGEKIIAASCGYLLTNTET